MKVYNKHIEHKLPINNINLKYLNETTVITHKQQQQQKKTVVLIIITTRKRIYRAKENKYGYILTNLYEQKQHSTNEKK